MENLELNEAKKILTEIRELKIKYVNEEKYYKAAEYRDKEKEILRLIEKLESENNI
jgi:hypothetical protein